MINEAQELNIKLVTKSKHLKRNYIILLIISLVFISLSFYFREELTKLQSFGLIGIFVVNVIGSATLFIPAPAIATVVAGGILYHPLIVAVVAALGSGIGDMIGYALGRSGKEVLFKRNSFWYTLFREIFHKFGAIFIIFFSFIPNPFFDAIGIFAGIFSYSPVKFFAYVLIGRFLRNLFLAYLGSSF